MKMIKKFTCCRCLEDRDVMSDKDTHPLYLCSACVLYDKTKHDIVVFLDGAPRGYVKGSHNPVNQKNPSIYKKKTKS